MVQRCNMNDRVLSSSVTPELLGGQTSLTTFLKGLVANSENILIKYAYDKNVGGFVSEKENSNILHQSRSDFLKFILFFADLENKNGKLMV